MNEEFLRTVGRKPQWIAVGGSYSGALSAWFKNQYPGYLLGAWSSSGVIRAVADFAKFDESLYYSTLKSDDLCPVSIRRHYQYIEQAFSNAN